MHRDQRMHLSPTKLLRSIEIAGYVKFEARDHGSIDESSLSAVLLGNQLAHDLGGLFDLNGEWLCGVERLSACDLGN